MQKTIMIKVRPSEAATGAVLREYLANALGVQERNITGFQIIKSSLDARGRQAYIHLTLLAFIDEPFHARTIRRIQFKDVTHAEHKVIIVGAGPAGLFAALSLLELGIQPVLLERGKDVRARRRDLALLNKEGVIHPDSNYCFGEGGAGTYSDGKLYTRSTKRGDINRILNLFVQFGADEKILYEAHPHIGTNKLPQIITNMRQQIEQCGGKFYFEKKVTDLTMNNVRIKGVTTADGDIFEGDSVILATGHSARDIFELLSRKQIEITFKPFALGVRIEHPQALIDSIQYHLPHRDEYLPPASYSLVQQVDGRGVFSFCMCPGGIIAPASTNPGELVVNGWSPSKRNNPYANSGIVVPVELKDIPELQQHGALAGLKLQQSVERRAFEAGGGKFVAPAQRMTDMAGNRMSSSLPACSYVPGIHSSPMHEILPGFIYERLRHSFKEFGKKMKGFFTEDAIVVATESRTSSPVRIPRDAETLQHPQVRGLFPCSEGAGYAGGIISAAMDGERVAHAIYVSLRAE